MGTSDCQHSWLDKYIDEQSDNAALISDAARATEMMSENDLEAYADHARLMAGMVC
jgi:hypothetical protein